MVHYTGEGVARQLIMSVDQRACAGVSAENVVGKKKKVVTFFMNKAPTLKQKP